MTVAFKPVGWLMLCLFWDCEHAALPQHTIRLLWVFKIFQFNVCRKIALSVTKNKCFSNERRQSHKTYRCSHSS